MLGLFPRLVSWQRHEKSLVTMLSFVVLINFGAKQPIVIVLNLIRSWWQSEMPASPHRNAWHHRVAGKQEA